MLDQRNFVVPSNWDHTVIELVFGCREDMVIELMLGYREDIVIESVLDHHEYMVLDYCKVVMFRDWRHLVFGQWNIRVFLQPSVQEACSTY